MNIVQALAFLAQNQPLPDRPRPRLLKRFASAVAVLFDQPDPVCIPLLLGAWGEWEDLSLHESVQSVLRLFPAESVVPHLADGLASPNPVVARWCADTARYFPDPRLIVYLAPMLSDSESLTRLIAASALEAIGGTQVKLLAQVALVRERDEDVIEVLEAIYSPPATKSA